MILLVSSAHNLFPLPPSDFATTGIHNLHFLRLPNLVTVALDVVAFICTVLAAFAALESHNVASSKQLKLVVGLLLVGLLLDVLDLEFLPLPNPITVALDSVGFISTELVSFASTQSDVATSSILSLEFLPLPNPVTVALDPVGFISTQLVSFATTDSEFPTTGIHNLHFLPLPNPVTVALDVVAFICTVLAAFAALESHNVAISKQLKLVVGLLLVGLPLD